MVFIDYHAVCSYILCLAPKTPLLLSKIYQKAEQVSDIWEILDVVPREKK